MITIDRQAIHELSEDRRTALARLVEEAERTRIKGSERIPLEIRRQIPTLVGYVSAMELAKAFGITRRHATRLLLLN